jgi:hypothetical protein
VFLKKKTVLSKKEISNKDPDRGTGYGSTYGYDGSRLGAYDYVTSYRSFYDFLYESELGSGEG